MYVFGSGGVGGEWVRELCLGCDGVCGVGGECVRGLDLGLGGWGDVMSECVVSLGYLFQYIVSSQLSCSLYMSVGLVAVFSHVVC